MKAALLFTILFVMASATPAHAEQFRQFGDYTVHYSAFTTDILTPSVAKSYGIRRSKNRALLNITVLKKVIDAPGRPVKARVDASATNLSAQLRELHVRELTETDAVYYLAETVVNDGETLKYDLEVTPEGEATTYRFSFYQQFGSTH